MSNKTITKLAETMNAEGFISELETRKVDFIIDEADNILDYNEGMVNLIVNDTAFLFVEGKLDNISY